MPDSTAPHPDAFSFERVGVTFGTTTVLHGVDFRVPATGITVVSGPSGSGKSTLTRLCNRLLDASEGTVRHRGRDVREIDVLSLRRAVGMVFQRPALFEGSVADNLRVTGIRDRDAHAAGLASVGMEPSFLDRAADTLSGGEAQRVCLARTLLMVPQVLVADEPTAALEEASARSLEDLACRLASNGVPVLWVTHDPAQAGRIADHLVTLDRGQVRHVDAGNGPPP